MCTFSKPFLMGSPRVLKVVIEGWEQNLQYLWQIYDDYVGFVKEFRSYRI
jgi:hypothetical protein